MDYVGRRFNEWAVGKICLTYRGKRTTRIVQHPRGGRHNKPATYNRSRYNALDDRCQMR